VEPPVGGPAAVEDEERVDEQGQVGDERDVERSVALSSVFGFTLKTSEKYRSIAELLRVSGRIMTPLRTPGNLKADH
jgi:hypothetical protein